MARLHDRIERLLQELRVRDPFLKIHAGDSVPLLTDFFVRCLPDEWNACVPPEVVDGRTLTPLFAGCDSNAIYCVDENSLEVVEIDPEDPWPPTNLYRDWDEFLHGLYSFMSEGKTESEQAALADLLQIKS